ncbi:MAG: type II toxin-antitoxin system Phd/YefM family antitoxin [Chloroflexota bacterium]
MATVNMHEAKTNLSRLIARAAAGEEIIIAKAGKPMARLAPIDSSAPRRPFGQLKGKSWMADDFDAPLPPDLLALFYGESEES